MQSHIHINNIDEIHAAGMNCIGVQALSKTLNYVLEWAKAKNLLKAPDFKMATIYYDSFKTTAPDKVRMCACLIVKSPIKSEKDIIATTINGGIYIIAHHEIGINEFESAWTNLFIWMNTNGYKMRAQPPFEIYHNDFNTHPQKKFIVDLYVPVE